MPPKPRFNLQFILNDLASVLEISDGDIPTYRLSLPHAASAVANRALYFATSLRGRPDVYYGHLALFVNDQGKIAARGALGVFQRASVIASKGGESALSVAHATRRFNTPTPTPLASLVSASTRAGSRRPAPSASRRKLHSPPRQHLPLRHTPSVTAWMTMVMTMTSRLAPLWWRRSSPRARGPARRPRHGTRPRRAPSMTCLWPSLSPASHLRYSGSSPPPTASSHG